jgi:hypothetical protein
MKIQALLLTGALAVLAVPSLNAQERERITEEFRWNGTVAAGRTVEIRGLNGGISATRGTGGQVEVLAVKSGRRSNPAEVQIQVIPSPAGVTICALYPTPANARQENECGPGISRMSTNNNDVSVEYEVRIPDGVHLSANTTNGGVEVNGLTGDVDVRTTNGGITISTAGMATARTTNGGIDVTIGTLRGTEDLDFRTTNGTITLRVPAGLDANVQAQTTNGSISSDFPITVQGSFGPRRLEGVIGSGGRNVVLQTTNGDVQLIRGF